MSLLVHIPDVVNRLKKEQFYQNPENNIAKDIKPIVTGMNMIFNLIVTIMAIYLSLKINKGFKFGSFLVACCCPVLYLIFLSHYLFKLCGKFNN